MTEDMRDISDAEVEDTALIVDFLQGRLDPEKVALVRRRLDEDEKFRDDMAPLILAWTIPIDADDKPLPPGELEKNWHKFSKKAGFVHHKVEARKRILYGLGIAILFLGLTGLAFRERIRDAWVDARDYDPLPAVNGVVTLASGARFELEAGSRLRIKVRDVPQDGEFVKLSGAAHVIVQRKPTTGILPNLTGVVIETSSGTVGTGNGEFHIEARGDSTRVSVLQHKNDSRDFYAQFQLVVVSSKEYPLRNVTLFPTDRAVITPKDTVIKISQEKRP